MAKPNKYRSRKVNRYGMTFDSMRELRRYEELRLLEKAGHIKNLRCQVPFELIPSQKIHGKVAERACTYKADFVYLQDLNVGSPEGPIWHKVVEDVKGFKTKDYIIKRKLMLWVHGIQIHEI